MERERERRGKLVVHQPSGYTENAVDEVSLRNHMCAVVPTAGRWKNCFRLRSTQPRSDLLLLRGRASSCGLIASKKVKIVCR
jgi:hypothetical protein